MDAAMGELMWMPVRPPRLGTLLAWHPQPIPVLPVLCLVLWLGYTASVVRLVRRRRRWPAGRGTRP